jgi:arylsulfatase A-like enzyme
VLLIMGDDIGYGHMGAFGGPANTPTFDRLAGQGLSLTNFHTTAVCAASRACLLTGGATHILLAWRRAGGLGGVPGLQRSIPRSAATVLEILRQNGYGTAWVGKTHLTPGTRSRWRGRSTAGPAA